MLKTGGFTAHELRELHKAKELKAAGFNAQALADGGFPANQLKLVGFTDTELKECGSHLKSSSRSSASRASQQ